MSEEIVYQPPLAIHFETRTLGEIGVSTPYVVLKISHQPTVVPKSGFDALLAKTPFGSDEPIEMDIDVSCGLYDEAGKLMEVVWYGNTRNIDETIRHHGDTFIGMNKAYRPSMIEESLTIRLNELEQTVHRVALFIHSNDKVSLNQAVSGTGYLLDSEGVIIHEIPFASLENNVYAICAWQLVRVSHDWRVSAPVAFVKAKDSGEIAEKWNGTAYL